MPILATPKPNKRDVNGYFNQQYSTQGIDGLIKGAKVFKHFKMNVLDALAPKIKTRDEGEDESDRLRSYAQVCATGLTFSGTLGVDNCSEKEAAALLILLEHDLARHGFKLGLGKSLGMGSVVSRIKRIWVRRAEAYAWESVSAQGRDVIMALDGFLPKPGVLQSQVNELKEKHAALSALAVDPDNLPPNIPYPAPLEERGSKKVRYWDAAKWDNVGG